MMAKNTVGPSVFRSADLRDGRKREERRAGRKRQNASEEVLEKVGPVRLRVLVFAGRRPECFPSLEGALRGGPSYEVASSPVFPSLEFS